MVLGTCNKTKLVLSKCNKIHPGKDEGVRPVVDTSFINDLIALSFPVN